MSTIPKNKAQLVCLIETRFSKLDELLQKIDEESSQLICAEHWSIKQLVAIRIWWMKAVIKWIVAGQEGRVPITPAKGYTWKQTPELNDAIAEKSKNQSFGSLKKKLKSEYTKLRKLVESMDETELMTVGKYEWAGTSWPVARWISVNTSRQFETAAKYIRKGMRENALS